MVTGLSYAFWDLLVAHFRNLFVHLHFEGANHLVGHFLFMDINGVTVLYFYMDSYRDTGNYNIALAS